MKFLTTPSQTFDVPKRISRLSELATNLWWSWNPEAARLFGRLDYDLWERLGHNPIQLLNEIDSAKLKQAAKDKDYLALYDALFETFDLYFKKGHSNSPKVRTYFKYSSLHLINNGWPGKTPTD